MTPVGVFSKSPELCEPFAVRPVLSRRSVDPAGTIGSCVRRLLLKGAWFGGA